MQKVVEIKDLNFSYQEKEVFKNLHLTMESQKFTVVLGPNGSGKTTLLKLLLGFEKGNSVIMLDSLPVIKENLNRIYKEIGVVFENQNQNFVAETVTDELAFPLENLNYGKEEITKAIDQVSDLLNIKHLLNEVPNNLNAGDKQLVALASALIIKPKILLIDEGLNNLDLSRKNKILSILKKLVNENQITIIYFTHDSEDTLNADNVIILSNGKVQVANTKEEIYKDENNFLNANLEPPFIIKLSKRLQFYDLIQDDYLNAEKLVNDLWK